MILNSFYGGENGCLIDDLNEILTHDFIKMSKQDKWIEALAWLTIIAVIWFCIRFNYKMYH
mgnify:CR=1 FL=1